jgi:hypothetical protein
LSKSGIYKGFSTWETKNGEETYSKLAVIPSHFEFTPWGNIKSFWMKTAFRNPVRQFSYGPFTSYRVQFTSVSDSELRGKMYVYFGEQETEVGDVIFEKE